VPLVRQRCHFLNSGKYDGIKKSGSVCIKELDGKRPRERRSLAGYLAHWITRGHSVFIKSFSTKVTTSPFKYVRRIVYGSLSSGTTSNRTEDLITCASVAGRSGERKGDKRIRRQDEFYGRRKIHGKNNGERARRDFEFLHGSNVERVVAA
jgi:hypothetical protein